MTLREAVEAALGPLAGGGYDVVRTAVLAGDPDADTAVLVRLPARDPVVLFLRVGRRVPSAWATADDRLRMASGALALAVDDLRLLREAFDRERDLEGAMRVLRLVADGSMTPRRAAGALGLAGEDDVGRVSREHGMRVPPPVMVPVEVGMAEEMLEAERALDAAPWPADGSLPPHVYLSFAELRDEMALPDDTVAELLGIPPGTVLPSRDETEAFLDRTQCGIEPGVPGPNLFLSLTVGGRATRMTMYASTPSYVRRVVDWRTAGRMAGELIQEEMARAVERAPAPGRSGP